MIKNKNLDYFKHRICVVGVGFIGLPLALEFSKKYKVIGYDNNIRRINELKDGYDANSYKIIKNNKFKKFSINRNLLFSSKVEDIKNCNIYIVTVPTPIYKNKVPNLKHLKNSSQIIGKFLKPNNIVIYESTVYPGVTEEICVPLLEKFSKLKLNRDFFCGYSPERLNVGDENKNLVNIKKIVSGSNNKSLNVITKLYSSIIKAGVVKVSSIKIAEAAKVIENTQRDINIALMNELSIIFSKMNLNTEEIFDAAATKWNFVRYKPGLVGGHCIGVDPYYLTYKSKLIGYSPKIILQGRKINDFMGTYAAYKLINKMQQKKIKIKNSKILIMGFTFKENCNDIRNTKVADLVDELKLYGCKVEIYDPLVSKYDINCNKKYTFITKPKEKIYDSIVIAVAHQIFVNKGLKKITNFAKKNKVIFDVMSIFKNKEIIKL